MTSNSLGTLTLDIVSSNGSFANGLSNADRAALRKKLKDTIQEEAKAAINEAHKVYQKALSASIGKSSDSKDSQQPQRPTKADWAAGAKAAYKEYNEAAKDSAIKIEDVFSNAFSKVGDVLKNYVKEGKWDLHDFSNSVGKDLAKVGIHEVMSQAFKSTSNLMNDYWGTADNKDDKNKDNTAAPAATSTKIPAAQTGTALGQSTTATTPGGTATESEDAEDEGGWFGSLKGKAMKGIQGLYSKYQESTKSNTEMTKQLFTDTFTGMEGALINFVDTGKLSFGDFAKNVIADLARIQLQAAATTILQKVVGFASGVLGGGDTTGAGAGAGANAGASGAGSTGAGFALGGYTGAGGVNQVAGVVHKGEVVWSQQDIARAGGVSAVEAMRQGAGTENSDGYKGMATRAMSSQFAVTVNAPVTVEQKGDKDGQVDQNSFSNAVQQGMVSLIRDAISKSWRPGGVSYKAARGIS